jgi:glutathione peroxidase
MKIALRIIILLIIIGSIPFTIKYLQKITIYNFVANDMKGNEVKFEQFKGKVLLIVNTATECRYTPQFFQLEAIYKKYKDRGFEVIAFPSDSFKQEPRTTGEVVTFCENNYLIDFKIFEKIDVEGKYQASIYKFLTEKKSNPEFYGDIKWNFTKFLIGKKGKVVARFESEVTPDDPVIIQAIEKCLNE